MRVEDILEAIAKIERYTVGMDYEAFVANEMAADAETRNCEMIGEAARHVPSDVRVRYPAVEWVRMNDMRNFLIHEYPDVELDIVWRTVQNRLPTLKVDLRELLERERAAEG